MLLVEKNLFFSFKFFHNEFDYLRFSKIDNDQGRAHELGQAAVKCMRGILNCWMKQAKKVRQKRKFST